MSHEEETPCHYSRIRGENDRRDETLSNKNVGVIKKSDKKRMMFVDIKIASTPMKALVDIGAMEFFHI